MANIDNLLNSLDKVRRTGEGSWVACCPSHADKSPSLSIRLIDGDKILLHCFGGCAVDEVVSAIGMTLTDLMPDNPGHHKLIKSRIPASDILRFIGFEAEIVMLAAGTIRDGRPLPDDDMARLQVAYDRLSGAVRECCR